MPRRKKLDMNSVAEALLDEVDARVARALNEALRDLHRRIDRLERNLSGAAGREALARSFKVCRKPGCNGRVIAHGLCSRHYQQWRYHRKKDEERSQGRRGASSEGSEGKKAPKKAAKKTARKPAKKAAGSAKKAAKKPVRKAAAKKSSKS